jgi:pimeloyl-ACP methyl ester carboxylesterase
MTPTRVRMYMHKNTPGTGRSKRFGTPALGILLAFLPGCTFPSMPVPDTIRETQFSYTVPSQPGWSINAYASDEKTLRRVIFVHGTPGAGSNFSRYILNPIERTQTVTYDRPGFGSSKPRAAVPDLAAQASALEPLLVQRDGHWPILVGHSLGGPIVCQAAAMYPDRIGGIVVLAGSLDPDLERVRFIQRIGNFFIMPYLIPRDLRNANREVLPLKHTLVPLGELLPTIKCPIVIVHGTKDKLVPFGNVEYMLEKFTPEQVFATITINNGNHFIPWNAEETVRMAVQLLIDQSAPEPVPSSP